jgi:pimeloyl-ACP methyl ester carboxylesterase
MPARAEHVRFPVSWMLAVCCAAAALAGCGSSGSSGPDVLTAPIQVVRTADGTSAVAAPASPSIPAMASQTSALISALGLGRPAVLGWSMGGMIAQALAISHPAQVSRLILAATAVGTGKAVPLPPSATMFALSPAEIVAQMFPKNQAAAASAYVNDSLQYPGSYQVSAATFHSQYLAAERWLAGQDAVGRLVGDIRVPTLVADGTLDQDIRPPNARQLAGRVPGAKLLLFPDAGHAFLFQDAATFTRDVEAFMG